MKNADLNDIFNINHLGQEPPFGVMFNVLGEPMHRVKAENAKYYLTEGQYIFEYAKQEGVLIVHKDNLQSIPKKQGTPAKPKKLHVKGTKPHLGYSSERIKPGVKVQLRNGEIRTVASIQENLIGFNGHPHYAPVGDAYLDTGRASSYHRKLPIDIIRILDNPVEPVKEEKVKEYYEAGDVVRVNWKMGGTDTILFTKMVGNKLQPIALNGVCGAFVDMFQTKNIPVEQFLDGNWHTVEYLGKFSDVFSRK